MREREWLSMWLELLVEGLGGLLWAWTPPRHRRDPPPLGREEGNNREEN